jgi:hypothetical protein
MMWFIKRVILDNWTTDRAMEEAAQLGLTSEPLKKFAMEYIESHKKKGWRGKENSKSPRRTDGPGKAAGLACLAFTALNVAAVILPATGLVVARDG